MDDSLLEGAIKFMEDGFLEHEELFKSLQHKQDPHTLFISCVDSRVVPNLITNCLPGELFMVRNIANIVPPYRVSEEFLATTSAIEYALELLNIKNIEASFVLGMKGDTVFISARSLGDINVHILMEKIGGGGHIDIAGAQLKDVSLSQAYNMVKDIIEEYLEEEEK